jgi:phosphatidylserine/phosphatidylglycerophosphate/cardiolipin synthase-like enzyme
MDAVLGEDLSRQVKSAASEQVDAEQLRRDARSARARAGAARVEAVHARAAGAESSGLIEEKVQHEVRSADARIAQLQVRPLAVYEHPALLRRAIEDADHRVLLVSPWIRRAVVGPDFVKLVRRALGRGVTFYVGYGLGEEDEGEMDWDKAARAELERLARESERFILKRLGDTHAKVLIKDSEFFVITSFNWLSFRGNPHQTFREEWGTYVGVREIVDEYFKRMLDRFK